MNKFQIVLPWPHEDLSPNGRVHWSKLAKAKKAAKNAAFYIAREAGAVEFAGDEKGIYGLTVIAHPPDKQRRDEDNIKASLKAAIDGMMFALGIDDSRIKDSHTFVVDPIQPGSIIMVLVEYEAGKPWQCTNCGHTIGKVLKKSSGSTVLRVQMAGFYAEIDSGLVGCPICGKQRKWVLGQERMKELLNSWRKFHRK